MTVRARPFLTQVRQPEQMQAECIRTPADDGTAARLVRFLTGLRVDLSDETRAQMRIEESLCVSGWQYTRGVPLDPGDRIDFVVGVPGAPGIGIDVKLRTGGSKREVFGQLERYARSPRISAIVLMTNQTMGLPEEIGGKPLFYVSLGRAWLS